MNTEIFTAGLTVIVLLVTILHLALEAFETYLDLEVKLRARRHRKLKTQASDKVSNLGS